MYAIIRLAGGACVPTLPNESYLLSFLALLGFCKVIVTLTLLTVLLLSTAVAKSCRAFVVLLIPFAILYVYITIYSIECVKLNLSFFIFYKKFSNEENKQQQRCAALHSPAALLVNK